MPLAPPVPQRIPGRLRSRGPLSQPNVLLGGWWFDPDRLSVTGHEPLSDPAIPVLVSAAFMRELSLKYNQDKLPELSGAMGDLPGLLQADGFEALPISLGHGLRAGGYSQPPAIP